MSVSFTQTSFAFEENNAIFELGSFGILKESHFSHPQFTAVDGDGNIYVSDLGNKRIQKFSSDGTFLTAWGQSGKYLGGFHYPSGIDVSENYVFVVDRELNKVQKFTLDGEYVGEWGQKGKSNGKFFFPNGIVVNNDKVYVVDTGNNRIQIFSVDGEFISSFGTSGLEDGQFLNPIGIASDIEGNVYVTDKGNHKIEKFTADGTYVKSFPFYASNYDFSPEAVAIDSQGNMFVVNSATQRILYLSQDSDLKLSVFDKIGPYPNSFDLITDVEFGINGELLIVDSLSHNIQFFETPFYTEPPVEDIDELPQIIEEQSLIDQQMPVIIAPESLIVEASDFMTAVSYGQATATDASGIKAILNNAPEKFSPGVTTIIWIAFDNVGYTSNTSQTVTVKTCGNDHSVYNIIHGTEGDDVLLGTDADDLIFGLSGDDVISGGKGNDCIFGGSGNDVISGDDGNDSIRGNLGSDMLRGNSGSDVIYSSSNNDVIDGGLNFDRCYVSENTSNVTLLNCEE